MKAINSVISDFEKYTGERAEFLYLGQNEWNALKKMSPAYAEIEDPQYMGLKILRVNTESHLAVS